ncbi:PAPS reductase-like domain protein [Methanosarcina virus MetMV]|jgi:phosphoadenosine phosphosulfate reductase|nr:PAPS reductase-like domain protein [Methanosarcina virus MetMV]
MSTLNLFSGKDKTEIAIDRIKAFCPPEGYYVAFSGGKDSIVILDLVKKAGVPFDAHYNITGIDPPELYYFIRDNFPEVERHKPGKTMWKLIEEKMMPPTRLVRYCCEYLKERGGGGRRVVTGVRWAESNKRRKRSFVEQCFKDKNKIYINPIIDWTDEDVWEYIKINKIKYCGLYDEGFKRLGCIGCPMAGTNGRKKEFKRWPKYEMLYKRAFDKIAITGTDANRILHWKNGEDVFRWWMEEDKHTKQDEDQTVMFE